MAALIFPSNPTTGQEFLGPYGEVYTWDGERWTLTTGQEESSLPPDLSGTTVQIAFFFGGQPPSAFTILVPMVIGISLPVDFAGSVGWYNTAPTNNADFNVGVLTPGTGLNGIGIVNFPGGGGSPTFMASDPVTVNAGQILSISAPTTQDTTFAGIGITLLATRT